MKAGFVALGLGYYMEDYLVDELYESTHKLPQQDLKCNSLMNLSRAKFQVHESQQKPQP
jgi:hypothetical protein